MIYRLIRTRASALRPFARSTPLQRERGWAGWMFRGVFVPRLASDPDPQVRLYAAVAMSYLPDNEDVLLAMLKKEKDGGVRFELVKALKRTADWTALSHEGLPFRAC